MKYSKFNIRFNKFQIELLQPKQFKSWNREIKFRCNDILKFKSSILTFIIIAYLEKISIAREINISI